MSAQQTLIARILQPVNRFIQQEYTSGMVLLLGVLAAIIWVNSPFHESYYHLWETKLSVGFASYTLDYPLHIWLNDGLMAVFFFVIGLELKREFMAGELSSVSKAALPMVAALGGMIVPALIYFIINRDTEASHGWGIPMATDIAFALALVSMVGKHVPSSVKVFLSALAVADDLGAVLVIAFFYSGHLYITPLLIGFGFLGLLLAGNVLGVRNTAFYVLLGLAVWVGFLLSGVHATIAGVLVAFTVPARTVVNEQVYFSKLKLLANQFASEIPNNSTLTTTRQHEIIEDIKTLSLAAQTPLQKIEHALHPWVAFIIMPLFALANAGIIISADFFTTLSNPISVGVAAGLLIGKFTGVLFFTWLMVKTGLATLPAQARWSHMAGVAILAGIGFTMSLFVSALAFKQSNMIEEAKYGILMASLIAGSLGYIVLKKRG